MKIEDLPESINDHKRRLLVLNNIVVIEYSKLPKFGRYLSGVDENLDDLLFEVMSTNVDDAIRQASLRINLPKEIHRDFDRTLNFGRSPILSLTSQQNQTISIKPFEYYYIWNMNENYQHIAIISTNFETYYKIIADAVEIAIEDNKQGKFIIIEDESFNSKEYVFTRVVFLYTDVIKSNKNEAIKYFKSKNLRLEIRDDEYRKKIFESKRPDFFICHDSRDKSIVAEPLFNELRKLHLKVWFDKYSLELGDSLTESINKGIKECRFGILILSKNFLSNDKWAKNELQSLSTKQIVENKKLIIPIWHEINENDLKEYSYWLLDKVGGNTNEGFDILANKLKEIALKTQK